MIVRQEQGDYRRSIAFGEDSIVHFRRCGDLRWLSEALIDTGTSAYLHGDEALAASLREEGFALCRAAGNLVGLAQAMNDLGLEALQRGDAELALAHFRESLAMMLDLDEKVYIAHPLASMANMLARADRRRLLRTSWVPWRLPTRSIAPFPGTRNGSATSASCLWHVQPLVKCDLARNLPQVAIFLSPRQLAWP